VRFASRTKFVWPPLPTPFPSFLSYLPRFLCSLLPCIDGLPSVTLSLLWSLALRQRSYVHINVTPDPTPGQTMRYKGGIHEPSETPSWSEDFKLRLQIGNDARRRLHISLWDWAGSGGADGGGGDRFLGGLSFTVEELLPPSALVDGWCVTQCHGGCACTGPSLHACPAPAPTSVLSLFFRL